MKRMVFKIVLALMVLLGVSAAFWIGGIIMGKSASDLPYQGNHPDYILILGCRLEGEEPGKALTERIDAAAEYLKAHPWSMAVCTGGQGADEEIDEATAISRALQKRGISYHRMILEKESTSTYENFLFAKQLLDERNGDTPYRIAFATSDFHVYRSRNMAKHVGFVDPVALSAKSSSGTFYSSFPREIAAVAAYWLNYR